VTLPPSVARLPAEWRGEAPAGWFPIFLNLIKQTVRCTGVILRDIQPDIDQVFFHLSVLSV